MESEDVKFIAPNRLVESWNISRSFLWRLEKAGLMLDGGKGRDGQVSHTVVLCDPEGNGPGHLGHNL